MLFKHLLIFALPIFASPAPSFLEELGGPPPPNCKQLFKDAIYDCGEPSDILQIKKVDITPFPPKKGAELNIVGTGYVSEDIVEGSEALVTVKYGFIKLLHKKVNLCDEIGNIGLKCPLKKGDNKIDIKVDIPKEIPPVSLYNIYHSQFILTFILG
jgi:hypothetical protein